ncbi:MAG: flagellar basal body rod protein FlgB, partial [Turicibacter sp.]
MISGSDSVFVLTKQALDAASLRQETITHNITNVKTKGYKAKVVD